MLDRDFHTSIAYRFKVRQLLPVAHMSRRRRASANEREAAIAARASVSEYRGPSLDIEHMFALEPDGNLRLGGRDLNPDR